MCEYAGKKVIVVTEWYNAFYVDGVLKIQAKPDYLDGETIHNLWPGSEYWGAYALADEGEFEDGYPDLLADLDLSRCEKFA